ncbi:MAG: helix-turn-helix domain-containing protein [Acidobacteria bacterium]|jgi:transcriptional regulator with XRE-family HTH domain|nr:helix-turn-helix domain-containing protein [Acidobacteriota bacterium]
MLEEEFLKNDVGQRFRQFRHAIYKTQLEIAEELDVAQSTIANIECGKAFPNLTYLRYLYHTYRLNNNWLLNGKGEIFLKKNNLNRHQELIDHLQIPFIFQTIMAKLVESKTLFKDNISKYFKEENEEEKEAIILIGQK